MANPPRFILFLPPPPTQPTLPSLRAAFGETLSQVLKEVASHSSDSSQAAILDIALACPHLIGHEQTPRSSLYDTTQASLAGIYKLVCVIAAKESINVEDADGVDVRVLLLAWSPGSTETQSAPYGPVISIGTLGRSGRQWQYAFGDESEAGEAMVKAFVAAKGGHQSISHVHGSASSAAASGHAPNGTAKTIDKTVSPHTSTHRHCHVAVGGTFDHLHIGHKLLLTMTVFAVDEPTDSGPPAQERSATLGITGDQLLKNKKHASVLESWAERQNAVQNFLDGIVNFSAQAPDSRVRNDAGPNGKSVDLHYPNGLIVKCTEIQDPFGPTITEEQISALIISGETRAGGKAVNDKRKEKGWAELEVFEVDVLDAEDEGEDVKEGFGNKLSSTAIREKLARKQDGGGSGKL
ncbi:hypothetical protein BAUCODRAFT_73913 [Baudoinia panamericana UAMH 10762]|uniref:Cytidyltransferase-like domain-containing protein n=1 Tax=Baudoinia panamericana (strain UAMH 10762) TaxID=717646 RepID=M2N6M1_BAUPA|nr:uncharacterized protein BAUCODRAFT_73913 [Baudoinia panamericana UAMH 10762]EMC94714.1 hypothetical protein BAUCODRAFT_73913 [Baudoinia panamericana UAMH 10762]